MPKSSFVLRMTFVAWAAAVGAAFAPVPAHASGMLRTQAPAPEAKPEMMESCPGLVAARKPRLRPVALQPDQVRITYVGHSTFLLESPQLVRAATDYNDYVKPSVLPDIVTMNHAHSTHYTDSPDPGIKHVLRGWMDGERAARHDVNVKDVRVRNVPTNIRSWGGGTERHGNSIFIFEMGNLCIAHLGHLHHTLTQPQLNEIGRVDVVMVPVDGTYTLDLEGMIEVLQALKAQVMIPMHYFSSYTLNRFLERAKEHFDVETSEIPSVVVSKATLPAKPKVLVLPGR
ncbi:MAG TPA: MBL fold metallo-hydrolase [Xanthobacteraceae bacterium]|nr:MBL fold metallo-hydrolase [Xanthobacteraceae bacterium]